jgi:uncharacterized protein YciI
MAESPSGKEIIAISRANKLVCEPMFVMKTVPGPSGLGPVLANLQTHLTFWAEMELQRVIFAAGPVMPADLDEPWSGEGMVIFRAASSEAARKVAEADPMHASGARTYELRPWLLNHLVT